MARRPWRSATLVAALALTVAGDGTTLLAGERSGRVRAIRDGQVDPLSLLDLSDQVVVEGEAACSAWPWHQVAGSCS